MGMVSSDDDTIMTLPPPSPAHCHLRSRRTPPLIPPELSCLQNHNTTRANEGWCPSVPSMDTTNARVGVGEWSALPRVEKRCPPSTPTRIIVPASEYELMRVGAPHSDDGHNKHERGGDSMRLPRLAIQLTHVSFHSENSLG